MAGELFREPSGFNFDLSVSGAHLALQHWRGRAGLHLAAAGRGSPNHLKVLGRALLRGPVLGGAIGDDGRKAHGLGVGRRRDVAVPGGSRDEATALSCWRTRPA